ncbi:LLM class flavin-dependent oxidoreductase [Mycobacterium seoulense]|uniref:LLM class flavin-dependent oxidoreductase n=1 Tax=Mycobacterium seoulense TaxID=386911 RepID=UPI003CF2264A
MTSRHRVKVGIIATPIAPFGAVASGFHLARLIRADSYWFGDHYKGIVPTQLWSPQVTSAARVSPTPDAYFEPTVALARLAGRSKMSLGASVTDPVRRSAADLARTWMTLHHATGGRAILGLGSGEKQNIEAYGDSMERTVSRLEETVRAVRVAWSSQGELVDFDGEWTKWHRARFALPPYKNTVPPIWLAAQGPRTLRMAGTLGDGWIGPDDGTGPEAWAERAGRVAAAAHAAGKDVESFDFANMALTVLAPDPHRLKEIFKHPLMRMAAVISPDSAWQRVGLEHPLGKGSHGLPELEYDDFSPDQLRALSASVTDELIHSLFYTGTGDEVARRLEPIVESGAKHVLLLDMTSVAGLRAAGQAQWQTARLVQRLRRMTPGRVSFKTVEG